MTVLDSFYILFKSNADDVKKGMTEVDKKAKETEKSLKNSNEEADKLGKSFVKLVEGGAALAGAYAGFSLIKNGVMNQIDYNKQLYVTSQLLGQNAGHLKQMAQASAESGGTREGALADMTALATLARQRNAIYDPVQHMARVRALYKLQNSSMGRQNVLDNSGYNDPGLRMQAAMSDAEFAKVQASGAANATLSDEQARKAFEGKAAEEGLAGSIANLSTTIGTALIPTIKDWVDKITGFVNGASGSTAGALGLGAAVIGGKALQWGVGGKGFLRLLGIGSSAEAAKVGESLIKGGKLATGGLSAAESASIFGGAGVAAEAGGAATIFGGGPLAWALGIGGLGYGPYMDALKRFQNRRPNSGTSISKSLRSGSADIKFWTDRGYTVEQAAGIMANIQAESGGDPNATGDSGRARGLAQWHPDRRAAILKGTGIDVWTASREKQMEAIAWEMNGHRAGFSDQYYRSISGAAAAGGYFSSQFESPADKMGNIISRGNSALALSSKYQSGQMSVSIGKIDIHAPGADASELAQHIRTAVIGACNDVQAKADNGRAG